MSDYTVYIDEAGDLGFNRGTRWFVLSAVIVGKEDEKNIRTNMNAIKSRLNVKEIHLRKITDFYKRASIVNTLNHENFTYINVLVDTNKMNLARTSTIFAYNYVCRLLLERVSWYLRDAQKTADIVLSARGTSRDGELIDYIQNKLLPYNNQLVSDVFKRISAKSASEWDLLQLADVCATTMFLSYEINAWGFSTPCYSKVLRNHLYKYNDQLENYGLKYFSEDMKEQLGEIRSKWPCKK